MRDMAVDATDALRCRCYDPRPHLRLQWRTNREHSPQMHRSADTLLERHTTIRDHTYPLQRRATRQPTKPQTDRVLNKVTILFNRVKQLL